MRTWLKWTAGGVVVVLGLAAAGVVAGLQLAERKRMRQVSVKVEPLAYTSDAQALARGRYLFESRGCAECHGVTGGGQEFVNDGKGTRLVAPNITSRGVVASYQPQDWVRTIRHGVKPDGRPVLVMPSEDYNRFTDDDVAAVVAYARSLPPQPGPGPTVELPLPAWVLYGYGAIPDAASRIDHTLAPAQPVPEGATALHGRYVANMCIGCHGESLSGGRIPGGPPDWPPAANLTPGEGSALARYQDVHAFKAMLHSGRRPDGTTIRVMPFASLAKLSEVDVQALYLFLKTLPPRPVGQH